MKHYPKYNQNQLTRTVVLEVFNTLAFNLNTEQLTVLFTDW